MPTIISTHINDDDDAEVDNVDADATTHVGAHPYPLEVLTTFFKIDLHMLVKIKKFTSKNAPLLRCWDAKSFVNVSNQHGQAEYVQYGITINGTVWYGII